MIRYKKIRGHKRIWKDIDLWVAQNKVLDIDYLKNKQRDYIKVWIPPFGNIAVLNSEFTPPKGKTRKKIINGIFEIYKHWKMQLDELGEPYYLKIWYFPKDVSKCQVVCAIGDFTTFYEVTFFKPKKEKPFPENSRNLNWNYRIQEHHITKDDIQEPDDFYSERDYLDHKKWIDKKMKDSKTRISEYKDASGTNTTYYSIKEYDVWLGGN